MLIAIALLFVVLPIAVALLIGVLGAPAYVCALFVITGGIAWFLLGVRITTNADRHFKSEGGVGRDGVGGARILAERPHTVWVPMMVTAGWIDVLAGLVWLAFVDIRVFAGALVALSAAFTIWRLRAPSRTA